MKTVIIFTSAYNNEKTLDRAISSILNQTHSNLIYHICDNGSTDSTREIILNYAAKDKRVVPILRDLNHTLEANSLNPTFTFINSSLLENNYSTYYFARLDADDEYRLDFFEKAISFIEKYNLDLTACGNDFIDARTNRFMGSRKLNDNLILQGVKFGEHFPIFHQFMRTTWAKLYRISLLKICDFTNMNMVSYGGDTIFALETFNKSYRIGILSESLYKYYLSSTSSSNKFDNKRIVSDQILHEKAMQFLTNKVGFISKKNNDFLCIVYMNAISDTINVLLNARIPVTEKLKGIHDIYTHSYTRTLAGMPTIGRLSGSDQTKRRLEIFDASARWMLSQKEIHTIKNYEMATDVLASMQYVPAEIPNWSIDRQFVLLVDVRNKMFIENISTQSIDVRIKEYIEMSPLMLNLVPKQAEYFKRVIVSILSEEESIALAQLLELSLEEEIPDDYAEVYIKLGENLAAAIEDSEVYIYFKKLWIQYLLDKTRIEEARTVLEEYEEILPGDEELKGLRRMLEGEQSGV